MAASLMGGRRWVAVCWVECVADAAPVLTPDTDWEWRISWDATRDLWRVDRRRNVPGH